MEQVVMFLKQVINGVQVGSIYALVALGYTMVYGIVKLLNFAHGDFIMVGAYISLFAMTGAGMPVWLAAIIAVAGCALLGVLTEKIAYKPLEKFTKTFGTYYSNWREPVLAEPVFNPVYLVAKTLSEYRQYSGGQCRTNPDQRCYTGNNRIVRCFDDCFTALC